MLDCLFIIVYGCLMLTTDHLVTGLVGILVIEGDMFRSSEKMIPMKQLQPSDLVFQIDPPHTFHLLDPLQI